MNTYKLTLTLSTSISYIDIPCFDSIIGKLYADELLKDYARHQPLSYAPHNEIPFLSLVIDNQYALLVDSADYYIVPMKQVAQHIGKTIIQQPFPFFPLITNPTNDYFYVSRMFFNPEKHQEWASSWKKRFDDLHAGIAEFGTKVRKVRIDSGKHKAYQVPLNLHIHEKVWFFFATSDIEYIEKLLSNFNFLGKKRNSGYGQIKQKRLEQVSHIDFNTQVLRPVPEQLITDKHNLDDSIEKIYTSYKAPYFSPQNTALCYFPFKHDIQ
jgi:hypothetical protein